MHRYVKWLNGVPAELRLLGVVLFTSAPLFPGAAFFGAFSWIVGLLFYRLCNIGPLKSLPINSHLNLVVIGAALALGSNWTMTLVGASFVASIATMIFTTMISRLFYFYCIPVLILPALVVFAGFQNTLLQNGNPWAFESAFSYVYLIGAPAILCFLASPILFAMFGIGLGVGALWQFAFYFDYFNSSPLLIAQGCTFALCASLFAMPSKKSMIWAVLSVGLLTLGTLSLDLVNSQSEIYHLTWWSNISCALTIYGSRMFSRYHYFSWRTRPEDKLEDKMTQWQRFRAGEPRVGLPFKGTWKVSQSFDGAWTHRGIWQHGIDFIVVDELGKSFRGSGYDLADYFAFGKDVVAPTSGYVVAMYQDFPDNPVGSVKNQNNFGNYVVIRDAYGAHVLLGHLKQRSITCALYQYVEANQVIGQCGNSGYSPEPHIHMHIQADAVVGNATIPFHLTNYLIGATFHFHGVPAAEDIITQLEINNSLSRSLGFRVNETYLFSNISNETQAHMPQTTTIENKLDPYWGSMYFTDGNAKLFHYRDSLTFYFYRYEGRKEGPLFDLMTALPRVPLIYGIKCNYEDLTPVMRWQSNWQRCRAFAQLIFAEKFIDIKTSFNMNCDILEIKGLTRSGGRGTETSCFLDPVEGFVEFTVGERKYEVKSLREDGHVLGTNLRPAGSGEKLRGAV